MHGYDLRKRLRGDFGLLSSLSFGSLYPALGRLEAAGAVHEVSSGAGADEAPSRGTFTSAGSIAGERAAFRARLASRRAAATRSSAGTRGRRVYELTSRGEELFQQLLENEEPKPEGGRGFALRWAFPRYLSPEARLSLLQRRRAQLLDAREGTRRAVESLATARQVPAVARRSRHGGDRARSELDRPSHRRRAGVPAPPTCARGLPRTPTQALVTRSEVVNAAAVHASPTFVDTVTERSEP